MSQCSVCRIAVCWVQCLSRSAACVCVAVYVCRVCLSLIVCVAVWVCRCVSLGVSQGVSLYAVGCVVVCVSLYGNLCRIIGVIVYVKSIDLGLTEILDASQKTSNRPPRAQDTLNTAESNDYTWVVTMGGLPTELAT